MTPFPFQREDLDTLRSHGYVGLLNMGTGSGKTAVSCWAIQESGAKCVLVVAPAQTMGSAWVPTVKKILGLDAREIGNGTKAKREAMADYLLGYEGIFLVTPQLLSRKTTDISAWTGDMLILDEAHTMANPRTAIQRRLGGFTPAESRVALSTRFPMRLALSGTALRNRFELSWGHSRFLWPHLDRAEQVSHLNFWAWQMYRQEHKEIYIGGYDHNGQPKKAKQYLGEKIPGKWVREAPNVISHFKRERCCAHHPAGYLPLDAPTERHMTVPLLPAQKKAIRELEDHYMTYVTNHPMVVELPLTKATRIRQFILGVPSVEYLDDDVQSVDFADDCPSPFLDQTLDLLTGEFEDEPVVIFTDSAKFAAVTVKRLNAAGVSAFEYSGVTRKDRDENMKLFGTKYRVVVAVLAAAAEGLDGLQRVSKTEIWLSSSTDQTLNEQAMGRLDRIGGVGQVLRIHLHDDLGLSRGKLNEALAKRLELNRSLRVNV